MLAVSSRDASSTTMISISCPALCALATAARSRAGRLCVGMMTLMRGIALDGNQFAIIDLVQVVGDDHLRRAVIPYLSRLNAHDAAADLLYRFEVMTDEDHRGSSCTGRANHL